MPFVIGFLQTVSDNPGLPPVGGGGGQPPYPSHPIAGGPWPTHPIFYPPGTRPPEWGGGQPPGGAQPPGIWGPPDMPPGFWGGGMGPGVKPQPPQGGGQPPGGGGGDQPHPEHPIVLPDPGDAHPEHPIVLPPDAPPDAQPMPPIFQPPSNQGPGTWVVWYNPKYGFKVVAVPKTDEGGGEDEPHPEHPIYNPDEAQPSLGGGRRR